METAEVRIRRLKMRSMRRGIKEMDLILSAFAEQSLAGLSEAEIALYEDLLSENDHDLYGWITGTGVAPDRFAGLVAQIAAGATGVARPE